MEIEAPGLVIEDEVTERSRRVMRELRQVLEPTVGQVSGAFVEDKGISLSVHYRMTPDELEPEIQARVRQATANAVANGDVIVVQGKTGAGRSAHCGARQGGGAPFTDGGAGYGDGGTGAAPDLYWGRHDG